jgi:hypothetical protein
VEYDQTCGGSPGQCRTQAVGYQEIKTSRSGVERNKYAKPGFVRIKDRRRKDRLAVAGVLLKLKKIQQMEVVWVEEKADEVTDGLVRCMHRAAITPISKMYLYN